MRHGPDPQGVGRGNESGHRPQLWGRTITLAYLQTVVAATTGLIAVLGVLLMAASLVLGGPLYGRAGAAASLIAAVPFLYLIGVPLSLLMNRVLVRIGSGAAAVGVLAYTATWAFLPYLVLVPGRPFLTPATQALLGGLLGAAYYGLIRFACRDPGREREMTFVGGATLVGVVLVRLIGLD
jgi:hypothetical protein